MKITALVENLQGTIPCQTEHGLSLYIETKHHTILSDAGQSDILLSNASLLGKDLTRVDSVFLSHGHYDHSGGILPFQGVNPDAAIYMHEEAGGNYYHKSMHTEKYIGIDPDILALSQVHLLSVKDRTWVLDDEISVFSGVTKRELWPEGNKILKKMVGDDFLQDEFAHEIYLVIQEEGRYTLISGCAHNGILNIMDKFEELYGREPDVVISGFHMMRKEYRDCDLALIHEIGRALKEKKTKYYTCHCTGEVAYEILEEELGEQISYLYCGDSITV